MKEMKQRRKKERTWAEAARLVLENYSDAPMTPKQILQVIEAEGLKEMSGTSPLACLNAMLHSNSRGGDGLFYKLPGRISLFTLKKDALQWSRNLSGPEGEELEDAESCGSNETSTVSGDNDASLDETSSNASCSTESQSRSLPATRESYRAVSQTSKQKKKTGVLLPRVVLTPLKVNGAHMESASGFSGRHTDGESSSSSLALCSTTMRSRTEIARDPPQLLRGIQKPATGQMKRNRVEDIDFETPGSILVNTNLRALINSRTFNVLPLHFQQQLLLLLPEVDRQAGADGLVRLSGSALNNEFFTHAAQSWRERLADGEFTHEMQVRIRQEMEKEKKVEQWKEKFFEDYYGQKLGLSREELQQQNSVQEESESRSGLSAQREAARPQRAPSTRQRDVHLKKHPRTDLRCRARRSLYKRCEPEQAEATKETLAPAPDSSCRKETQAEAEVNEGTPTSSLSVSLKPASSPETSRLHGKPDELPAAASVNRLPSVPQESVDRESKDQKRKGFEQAASASFPEKKPRLEDRQSFRNTIDSVHPEKPQPTKEEPKVPPIRIQLSRIKPPWVVKGQPAYQICPRIIPSAESSRRGRSSARTLADVKARALQARTQREAAATAIGGGGGPGGGGGSSTDEGGGGRGEPSNPPQHRRSKRTRGKYPANLQRTQLLPPFHVNGERSCPEVAGGVAKIDSPASESEEPSPPIGEGGGGLEPCGAGQAAPLTNGSASSRLSEALTPSSTDSAAAEGVETSPERLLHNLRTKRTPGDASQEGLIKNQGCTASPGSGLAFPQVEGPVTSLVGEIHTVSGCEDLSIPRVGMTLLEGSYDPAGREAFSRATELSLRGKEGGLNGSDSPTRECGTDQDKFKTNTVGMENVDLWLHSSPQAATWAESGVSAELPQGGDKAKGSSGKLLSPVNPQNGIGVSESLPQSWDRLSEPETENIFQLTRATPSVQTSTEEEMLSMHSETDTVSDFEAELTDEHVEMDTGFRKASHREMGAAKVEASCKLSIPERDVRSESSVKTVSLACMGRPPPATPMNGVTPPKKRVAAYTSLPQKPSESSLHTVSKSQKRPSVSCRPVSSVKANNPLVMQLLKGSLPLEMVVPVPDCSKKLETGELPSDRQSHGNQPLQIESNSERFFVQEHPQDGVINTGRNSLHKKQDIAGTVLPRSKSTEIQADVLEKASSIVGLSLDQEQVVSGSQPETGPRERTFSSCAYEDQKELSQVDNKLLSNVLANHVTSKSPKYSTPPIETPLGPNSISGASVNKNIGMQGRKLFGSSIPCNMGVRPHHPIPAGGTASPSKPLSPHKHSVAGGGAQAVKEECPPKQRAHVPGGIENENILSCGGPGKKNVENRKEVMHSPVELMEHLQSVPLVMDLPFFKLPRESGKGLGHPLEPSSIPSQLNIKQAFYGKLSKLQLNSTNFNYSSNTPAFPRSFAGSMMQLSHKANFAANRNASLSVQMFTDSSSVEEISLKCSCSLKAMIMCKGCGAFCHDDCIGPSKLCVLCLVVR